MSSILKGYVFFAWTFLIFGIFLLVVALTLEKEVLFTIMSWYFVLGLVVISLIGALDSAQDWKYRMLMAVICIIYLANALQYFGYLNLPDIRPQQLTAIALWNIMPLYMMLLR